jgi:SAM-dependent methyltransferase
VKVANDTSAIIDQNIAFYDGIANDYDRMMELEKFNRPVREKVAEKFRAVVPGGRVLDFGGGTGQDLTWLSDNGYKIVFCEPAAGMMDQAVRLAGSSLSDREIFFLEGMRADFRTWNDQLPFSYKVDALLSNFAAINCIPDLRTLFASWSLVLRQGGQVVLLMLEGQPAGNLYRRVTRRVLSFFSGNAVHMSLGYKNYRQTVYVHSEGSVRKAASDWFEFCPSKSLPGSGFTLIHLVRK